MPLDSDMPNADAQLHVEFYESKADGYQGVPFVRIMIPGDKTNIYDQPAGDHHKQRFPRQWLFFQMKNSDGAVIGTPLAAWHRERPEELTEGQLGELTILKFQTVEQLATASDAQIQRVGMGAAGLRERARLYLNGKNAAASGAQLAKQQDEIEMLKAALARLTEQQQQPPATQEKTYAAGAARRGGKRRGAPKGGWPKKVVENVNNDDVAAHAAGGQ